MTPTDRRTALQTIAFAALAPMGAFGLAGEAAFAAAPLTVPAGPMMLRRTIERALGETAMLSVRRAWECRFVRTSGGIRIDGRQVEVAVDAPPSLAAMARIEREREVTGLFPANLDQAGRLVEAGLSARPEDLRDAIDAALAMVSGSAIAADAKVDARQFLARLGKTAAELVSRVQADLFYPVEGDHNLVRDLPLSEGASGTIEVEWSARARPTGVLEFAEKRIVTRVEGSARLARERWELEQI